MDKFEFLLGSWDLEYRIPRSTFNEPGSDKGVGRFKKALDDKYVFFEYSTISGSKAKGIFAWDEKIQAYRYWWFENSGTFLTATCDFVSDDVLAINWHDSLFVQTFAKESPDKVVMKMQSPTNNGEYELILEVIFIKEEELVV